MKTNKFILSFLFLAAFITAGFVGYFNLPQASASVSQGSDYQGTTTSSIFPSIQTLSQNGGALGSVVITAVGAGFFTIYDATTTDATKRSNTATTTLASFPTSAAVGTYTFDEISRWGITVVYSGAIGTSTITWRY